MLDACPGPVWRPTAAGVRKQLAYSLPVGLGGVMGQLSLNLDKVIVSSMCAPAAFAIYVNGAMRLPIIDIVASSLFWVLLPDMAKLRKEGQLDESHRLWKRGVAGCGLIMIPISIFLGVVAPQLMRFLFSPEYEASSAPFRVYLWILPVRALCLSLPLMAAGKNLYLTISGAVAFAVNAGLSICLVKSVGYLGASIATVATVYLWAVPYNIWCVHKVTGQRFSMLLPYRQLAETALLSLVCVFPVVVLVRLWPMSDLMVLGTTMFLYAAMILVLFNLTGKFRLVEWLQRASVRRRRS
jgi:O-antigen/teichoic acid export membrane protein